MGQPNAPPPLTRARAKGDRREGQRQALAHLEPVAAAVRLERFLRGQDAGQGPVEVSPLEVGAEREHAEGPRLGDFLVAAGVVPDVDVPALAGAIGAGVGADYVGVGGGGYCCRQGEGEELGEVHGEEKVVVESCGCVGLIV